MDNEKFQELVLEQFQAIAGELKALTQGQRSLENGQRSLENGQKSLEKGQRSLENGQKSLGNGQRSLENGQKHLTDRLTRIETVVARIENDHGAKLAALLDGYYQNTKILADHTERLDRIESKITAHDIQISILDKTKSNKRKAK